MKLLVSGCSFSAGAEITHTDSNGVYCQFKDAEWLWPNDIKNRMGYELHNIAMPGNSNDKIIRSTVEWLEHNGHEDTAVIVQFSSPYRLELYNELINDYVNYCTTGHLVQDTPEGKPKLGTSISLFDHHTDNIITQDQLDRNKLHKKTILALSDMLRFVWNDENIQHQFLMKALFMHDYLSNKNIPYIFTSMSGSSNPLQQQRELELQPIKTLYTRMLLNMVDYSKWMMPMTSFMGNNTLLDGHPNETGNRLIADNVEKTLLQILQG